MWRVMHGLLLTALLAAPFTPLSAQAPTDDDIRKLDDQVQDVKTEVLDIAAELDRLEQQLLYPSETRLTVSMALGRNRGLRPSAVELRIDGELTAHHVYTTAEQEALQKGGVQTLYRGNIRAGAHQLEVRIFGRLADGAGFEETGGHAFTKGVGAKKLGIWLDDTGRENGGIRIEDR